MTERVHATTVAIGGHGVMIVGPSGSGKSDLALRLIDRGAVLVSDDYSELSVVDGALNAAPPATIAGQIEVRGIGIVRRDHAAQAPVLLIIALGEALERMPEPRRMTVAGIELPAIAFDAREPSAPIKVEIALARLVEQQA